MKKIAVLILAVMLIISASACADTSVEAWMIEGAWLSATEYAENGISLIALYLTEDGRAYYLSRSFYETEPSKLGREFVGSWSFTGPNTINVIIGNNSSLDLKYENHDTMTEKIAKIMFFRAEWR